MEEQRTTTEGTVSGCYQCGASDGSMLQLCRGCLEANEERRFALKRSLTVDNDPKNDPLLFQFINSFAMQLGAVIVLFLAITVPIVTLSVTMKASLLSAILISVFLTAVIVAFFSWIFFWVNLLFDEAPCAIAALFVPIVAYRYAFLHWQETKHLFLFHAVSVLVAVASVTTVVTKSVDLQSLRGQAAGARSKQFDRVQVKQSDVADAPSSLFDSLLNQSLSSGDARGASAPSLADIIKLQKSLEAGGDPEVELEKLMKSFEAQGLQVRPDTRDRGARYAR